MIPQSRIYLILDLGKEVFLHDFDGQYFKIITLSSQLRFNHHVFKENFFKVNFTITHE